nr:DUF6206 family protein [Hasllibacter sp. MH4015]
MTGAIRAALADAGTIQDKPRYFGVPMRPLTGPLADRVLTLYRGGRDPEVQELLARRHEAYTDCLRLAGVRVPDTQLRLLDEAGTLRPVIVQRAIPEEMMLPHLLKRATPETAIGLLDQIGRDVAEFWRRVAQRPERIGFHSRIERFGMDETGPLFLDTFPPLISYDRDEMGQLIHRFADNGMIRGLGKILPGRLRDLQDRWYTPAGSVSTLVEGALQVRPRDHEIILDWARDFASRRLEGPWREAVHSMLARQQRQVAAGPRRWTGLVGGRDRPHA